MSEENKNTFDENEVNNQNPQGEQGVEQNTSDTDTVYFATDTSQSSQSIADVENNFYDNTESTKKSSKKRVSIKTFIVSLIAITVASVMLTYSICSSLYQSMYAKAYVDANQNSYLNEDVITTTGVNELDIIAQLIKDNYYGEVDSKKLMEAAIREYINQTGDIYAAYYTQEELIAILQEDIGLMSGIGVNIINTVTSYNGSDIAVLKIININKDSPAQKEGLKVGDYVYAAIVDGVAQKINDIGYSDALDKLQGDAGTTASFIVLRPNNDNSGDNSNNSFEEITFNIVRENIISQSVYYRIPEIDSNADKKIGVVKISSFDYTTPTQFTSAIEALKSMGCEKFIFDVRNNPGGYQSSVGAILSYFLNEGDVYIHTKDKEGNIESETVQVVSDYTNEYAGCNISKEDIGKYKNLDVVVLCNEYTASAGELFVATFKDYKLGTVVGNKTFGKGKLQSTYYLQQYALFHYGIIGIDGAVKITTHEYFSALSDSYDGIGIEPNEKILLSEQAANINVYDFEMLDPIDDQLLKGINILKG